MLLVATAAYAVYHGIETIARVTELLMPIGIGVLLLVGLIVLPEVNFSNYLPVLDEGIGPVLNGATRLLAFLGEGVIILMLIPYCDQPQKVVGALSWSIGLLGIFFLIGVLAIGMFGPVETAALTFPALNMVRRIIIGDFLQHLDAIIMTIWIGGIYIKTAVAYYICCLGYAQLFNLQSYQVLIWPVGIITAVISISFLYDLTGMINYLAAVWTAQAITFEFIIPLLLLIVAAARGVKGKKAEGNKE